MKRLFLICIALLCAVGMYAQDLITKKSGEDIQAKIIEVTQNEVKYKKYDNQDGPTFVLSKSDILIVRYQDGTNEVFDQQQNYNSYGQNYGQSYGPYAQTPYAGVNIDKIKPGMEYKDYKNYYDTKNYLRHQPGNVYSPALCGVLSFLVPGVGQFVCGQVGRGFVWLGSAIGCAALIAGGSVEWSYYLYDNSWTEDYTAGLIMMIVGAAGLATVDVWSIIDAVKMAKIKDMYNNDVKYFRSISMNLQPSVTTIKMGDMTTPVVGASLAIKF